MIKIKNYLDDINTIKSANKFEKYIEYIRFPLYKNLQEDTKIEFNFPLTVFIGANGSGKSSTLHALYGAPEGNSTAYFWFETAIDPIIKNNKRKDNKRTSLVYGYKSKKNDEIVEAIKQRTYSEKAQGVYEYWEPSRPLKWAGMKTMSGNRTPQIRKNVEYIDFRGELSAFDKYFYFKKPSKKLKAKTKQDYLREKSRYLKNILDNTTKVYYAKNNSQNHEPIELKKEELKWIRYILKKNYKSGKIIEHKFFEDWGFSVYFETPGINYSEAAAGSGEVVIVRLIHRILNAPDYSLILLDEPEVSLHPGAQERLKLFLLEQIKKKKHQIILSTHSPELVKGLPPEAIKVFTQHLSTSKFKVISDLTPEEAFYHIELPVTDKKTIIVEDQLAKSIVETVLNEMGEDIESNFNVTYYYGGHTVIKSDFIKVFSQEENWNKFVLFDGDQEPTKNHFDIHSLPDKDLTKARLKQEIKNQTNVTVNFKPDGQNNEGREDQEIQMMKKYLNFFKTNVFYLPKREPEEIIWNSNKAKELLDSFGKNSYINAIDQKNNYKDKFCLLTEAIYSSRDWIGATYDVFLNYWRENKNGSFQNIKNTINQIRNINV